MPIDRLPQLQKNLSNLYGLLGAAEDGAIGAISKVDKRKYEMEAEELKPRIQQAEKDLFGLLEQSGPDLTFVEKDAQATIDAIGTEVVRMKQQPDLSGQMLAILERLEAKLNEPGVTADAKLKGTLSILPPFIGLAYEGQVDTENFCRKYFPTFTRLINNSKKP